MEATQKAAWKIKGADGKFLSAKGWFAQHNGNESSCFVPLHKNGKVVALIVATGDYDTIKEEVETTAAEIVAALDAKNKRGGYCSEGDKCLCGGDTPGVRAGCAHWMKRA